jgi:hypothetical protein
MAGLTAVAEFVVVDGLDVVVVIVGVLVAPVVLVVRVGVLAEGVEIAVILSKRKA